MNVLLSSLGETPAVVTETMDALEREERIKIDLVITVGTSEWTVQLSQVALQEEFGRLGISYIPDQVTPQELLTGEEHLDYLNRVALWLRQYQKHDVYLSLAGGRKTMSALLTIAAQIYGARMLCHVVPLDEELEQLGEIQRWSNLPKDEQQRVLHPPADKVHLVRLPFISLFPLSNDIIRCLKGQPSRPDVCKLLEQNRLWEEGQATELGRMMLLVLESVEALPEPRSGECEIHLATGEPKEAEATKQWAAKIDRRFSFVRRIDDIGWREGQPKIKTDPPSFLILFLPGKHTRGIGFRLTTTAQTDGQLKKAMQ